MVESVLCRCWRNWPWRRYDVLTSRMWSGWIVGIVRSHGVNGILFAFANRGELRVVQYKVKTTCTSPVDVGHVGCSDCHVV
jgi:hypothetical protein